jgi:hypothetical protein
LPRSHLGALLATAGLVGEYGEGGIPADRDRCLQCTQAISPIRVWFLGWLLELK